MMPGLDGWRVAQHLQESPATRDIPVVFLTPRRKYRDHLLGLELGAIDYITVPCNPLDLAPRIEELLGRVARGERDELRREKLEEVKALVHGA